jgi:hypothetical protein
MRSRLPWASEPFTGPGPFVFETCEFVGDGCGFGFDCGVVEAAFDVGPVDLQGGGIAQHRTVVQDRGEVCLVDGVIVAAVIVAQCGQRGIHGGGGVGASVLRRRGGCGLTGLGGRVVMRGRCGGLAGGVAHSLVGAAAITTGAGTAATAVEYRTAHQ